MNNLNPLLEITLGKSGIRSTWNGFRNTMFGGRHRVKYGPKTSIQKVKKSLDNEQRKISKAASETSISKAIQREAPKNPLGELGANHDVRSGYKKDVQKWARNAREDAKKTSDDFRNRVDRQIRLLKAEKQREKAISDLKRNAIDPGE